MRWAFCIPLIFLVSSLFGQSSDVVRLEAEFEQAAKEGNRQIAQSTFHSLFRIDKVRAASLEPALHGLLYDPQNPSQGAIDTMLNVYNIGLSNFVNDQNRWLKGRAVFAYRLRDRIPNAGAWLLEALEADALGADVALFDMWSETVADNWSGKKRMRGELVVQWGQMDRLLYLREIAGEGAREAVSYRLGLRKTTLEATGGCRAMTGTQWADVTQTLHAVALCPNTFSNNALNLAGESASDPGWALRLQANLALNQGKESDFLSFTQRALAYEQNPLLKADLHYQRAIIFEGMGKYKDARTALKAAIKTAPDWGQAYIKLADLYVASAATCGSNEFDRKAVYWLALDVIVAGRNHSKGFSGTLDEKFVEYSSKMPTMEEARFRSLGPGDTWPIKCWMNTVTTVKDY